MTESFSPIRATVSGWNPLLVQAPWFTVDVGLGEYRLSDLDRFEGSELQQHMQRYVLHKQWQEDDITLLLQRGACIHLLQEPAIALALARQLLPALDKHSQTRHTLEGLLPTLTQQGTVMPTPHQLKRIRNLIDKAPEFATREGAQTLHQALAAAHYEQSLLRREWNAGNASRRGWIPVYYQSAFFNNHCEYKDKDGKKQKGCSWNDAYAHALRWAARDLDRNPKALKRYNGELGLLRGHILDALDSGLSFSDASGFREPFLTPLDVMKSALRSLANMPHRPKDAYAVSDDEAIALLHSHRGKIKDPQTRAIVNFILARPDVHVEYVGGHTVYQYDDGELACGTAQKLKTNALSHHYGIDLSSLSRPATLGHECMHVVLQIMYNNDFRPFAARNDDNPSITDEDYTLFLSALRHDTRAKGMKGSGLRKNLGIGRTLYSYSDLACEIPACIISARVKETWVKEMAQTYPALTAYFEKIVLRDIEHYIGAGEGFVDRPKSFAQLMSADWPAKAVRSPITHLVKDRLPRPAHALRVAHKNHLPSVRGG